MTHLYDTGLAKNSANYVPLSPLSFLVRAAHVYPRRAAVVHGDAAITWSQLLARCTRLASALVARGIGRGDTVAVMLANTPPMVEAHFGIPMAGAVLCALNTRLDAEAIAFMLEHSETKLLIVDREFSQVVVRALGLLKRRVEVVVADDTAYFATRSRAEAAAYAASGTIAGIGYERFIDEGDATFVWTPPADEWDAIALNYTSGTTGNPKGVVYHHRGAYLNAIGNAVTWGMPQNPVYLWTLPMFHCNGWCFPWTVAALGGTHVCLRKVEPGLIFELIRRHRVTHYCGAPIVHSMLINAPDEMKQGITHGVKGMVAAAAPPASMIEGMAKMGFELTHVYGLTEVYGPASVCAQHPEWAALPLEEQVRLNGRQGVAYPVQEGLTVMEPSTMTPVPADGETMGEIMFRGNIVMKGYLKNAAATDEAFRGGWFHTGDLAVMQPDGYVKIKDRSKDIIISGGENISSLEVEDVLYRHPAVLAAAVVAMPDEKWGEVPCAFVEIKEDARVTEAELMEFARARLARFKAPKRVVFGALPKTSTGKIQKFALREQVKSVAAIDT